MDSHTQLLIWIPIICIIGYLAYKGLAHVVGKEGLVCKMTCASFKDCGSGTHVSSPSTQCKDTKCTAAECCIPNPTCKSMKGCPSGRQFKPNYKKIVCKGETCKDGECCNPLPQPTCVSFPCAKHSSLDKNAKDIKCAGGACTDNECCSPNKLPSCFGAKYKCPINYSSKSNSQNIQCSNYTCTLGECCSPNPTCDSFSCETGFHPKEGSITCKGDNCSNSECCNPNPKCSTFTCADGFTLNPNAETIICNGKVCKNCQCCTPIKTPNEEKEDVNIFFPGTTIINFEEEQKKKKVKNKDIYRYSTYDNWTTPHQSVKSQINNMFSAVSSPYSQLVGPVNNADPFATTAPPTSYTQFGPTAFNISSYNER